MSGTHASEFLKRATLLLCVGWAAIAVVPAQADSGAAQITVLYDAFGKTSTIDKPRARKIARIIWCRCAGLVDFAVDDASMEWVIDSVVVGCTNVARVMARNR